MKNLGMNQEEATPTITNEIQLEELETHILKVHVNCDGCRRRVKKLLRKIEGVYSVEIDAEEEKVTVRGEVDSSRLIRKLIKSGKHAELWFPTASSTTTDLNEDSEDDHNLSKDEEEDTRSWFEEDCGVVGYIRTPAAVGVGYDPNHQGCFYDGRVGLVSNGVPGYMYHHHCYPPSYPMMPDLRGYGSYLPNIYSNSMMADGHMQIHPGGSTYPLRCSRY